LEKAMERAGCNRLAAAFAAAALLVSFTESAQAQFVNDINGMRPQIYIFQCCDSVLSTPINYPASAIIEDQFNGPPIGADFANRHDLYFSNNGGTSARTFNNSDSFDVSFTMKLEAGVNIPRKEAGLMAARSFQDGRFIVTTNQGANPIGEIVAFGGPFPFYSFTNSPTDPTNPGHGITYTPGTEISLRMIYNAPGVDPVAQPGTAQYFVTYNGSDYQSPVLNFTNSEGGIVNNNKVGVYMQATPPAGAAAADDFGKATFTNFVFGTGDAGLDGDFNNDGFVDGADYVMWKKDNSVGDYSTWVQNFGASSGGAGGVNAAPEPGSLILGALAVGGVLGFARRR
jgi:hypothetical protein